MTTIFIRTIIFYILIVLLMRLTGKRQIGQLELSELVTAFMLSELASYPISNNNIPLLHGLIPALILIILEVIVSFITTKSNIARKLLVGSPSTLIKKGIIDQRELKDSRMPFQEVLSALRNAGITSIDEVDYMFLEPGGKISVIPKTQSRPVTPQDLSLSPPAKGIEHAVIVDGVVSEKDLSVIAKSVQWLNRELQKNNISSPSEVFYMGVDDQNNVVIIKKEHKS